MSFFDPAAETEKIIRFLQERVGGKHVIIGISGGIDSSVVLKISSLALKPESIHPFFLPEERTLQIDRTDVEELAKLSGVRYETKVIDPIVESFGTVLNSGSRTAMGNLKSRIRMTLLYFFSNMYDGLVLGTTNRTEHMTGYFTKYGDGGCDLEPIMHLYKTQVKEIAVHLGLPAHIINKPPTAGLWKDQTDEGELGISYRDLDLILQGMDSGIAPESDERVQIVNRLISESAHKRTLPESIEFERE